MKGKFSRVTLLILLCALVLTSMLVPMQALAASPTGYTSANDVVYNTSGKYIYNWGYRGEQATFLTKYALQFYTGSYTFDSLSKAQGGTSQSNASSSTLYTQLKNLMTSKHTFTNGYSANNTLLQYTDCQNGGGKISSFYSGKEIGPAWDSAATWNKEHTWPNSKGLGGSDEDDVMMIRPTAVSENSSRGNTAYGESSGYYNPNSESGGKYDLRGDCARIVLYVYVRWGNTSYMWGKSGVIESMEVLLKWMQQDPVDTWEMGRNDAVQAITGTRNVFVDYPEYAWLLFGQSVPANYATPSGSNGATPPVVENCEHTFSPATCTQPQTCTKCWTTQGSELGHTTPDEDGLCTRCGTILQLKTAHAGTQADPYSIADVYKVAQTLTSSASGKVYVKGQVVNVGTVQNNKYRKGIEIKDSSTNESLYINTANPKTTAELNLAVGDTILLEGYIRINNTTQKAEMGSSGSNYTYYSIVAGEQGGTTHTHSFGAATCTKPATCSCGETQGTALGHTTTNGTCTRCGQTIGNGGNQGGAQVAEQKTIDLTSASNKVSASGTKLAFAYDNISVSIDKANATSDLVDYTGSGYAARVYQGATVTVTYPQMTKIVINCDDYTSGGKTYYSGFDGMNISGATMTREGTVITIVFTTPVDTFTTASTTSQVRIKSIVVYSAGAQTHTHSFGDATCTQPATCSCGATQGTALGHTTTNGTCTRCGETIGNGGTVNPPVVTPDQTVEAFKTAVANIQNATTMQEKFDAIKAAVNIYNTLSDTQKSQATTEIETLNSYISNYNQNVEQQNATANDALKFAIQVGGFVTLVAAAFVLNKKVF